MEGFGIYITIGLVISKFGKADVKNYDIGMVNFFTSNKLFEVKDGYLLPRTKTNKSYVKKIIELFPVEVDKTKEREWKRIIEKYVTIDGKENFYATIAKARGDVFWKQFFIELPFIEKKNRDGIKYYIIFKELNNRVLDTKNKTYEEWK